jgi:type II secretory pathway pseudopilin PulG
VELLVSMALIVFIMSILSTAFVAASKAFTDLKAAGELAERLRTTMSLLRRDLASPHFDASAPAIYRKMSDKSFWAYGQPTTPAQTGLKNQPTASPNTHVIGPPDAGFFRIWQGQNRNNTTNGGPLPYPFWTPNANNTVGPQYVGQQGVTAPTQGIFGNGTLPPTGAFNPFNGVLPTYTSTQSALHFTVNLAALLPNDYFTTDVTPRPFAGQQLPQIFWDDQRFTNNTGTPAYVYDRFTTMLNEDRAYEPTAQITPSTTSPWIYKSPSAEVTWWLAPSYNPDGTRAYSTLDSALNAAGQPLNPATFRQPLFMLCRRQRLLWNDAQITSNAASATAGATLIPNIDILPSTQGGSPWYEEMSVPPPNPLPTNQQKDTLLVNKLGDSPDQDFGGKLTIPPLRWGMYPPLHGPAPNFTYTPPSQAWTAGTPPASALPTTEPTVLPYLPTVASNNPFNLTSGDTYAGIPLDVTSMQNLTDAQGTPLDLGGPYPPPYASPSATPPKNGRIDDIVLDNVLSFDVRILVDDPNDPTVGMDFRDLFDPLVNAYAIFQPGNNPNQTQPCNSALAKINGFPNNGGPTGSGGLSAQVFDTWSQQTAAQQSPASSQAVPAQQKPNCVYDYTAQDQWQTTQLYRWELPGSSASIPMFKHFQNKNRIRIRAIQVTLRIWDPKAELTRQMTIVQDL